MAGGNIWFDGVDKKLIEAHATTKTLVVGNDKSLKTKTPLASLSFYAKKRKKESSEQHQNDTNGTQVKIRKSNGQSRIKMEAKDTIKPNTGITEELAIDCEMVECYHHKSVLARVSIVNLFGHPILDSYVAPPSKVTDYRTKYSGVRRKDLEDAPDFESVQNKVKSIVKDRIVVGHAIHNDFQALKISHPPDKTRDTQVYYKSLFQGRTPSLKKLSESLLGIKIQKGEHDSVQDAQATMKLYVKERAKWDETLSKSRAHVTKKSNQTIKLKKVKQKTKPKKKKEKTFFVLTT